MGRQRHRERSRSEPERNRMLNPFIFLTPRDQRLARELAHTRYTQDRAAHAKDLLQGDPYRKHAFEVIGVCGELAFSRWMGIDFDPNQRLIPGSPDFIVSGVKIDVKASDRPNGDLVVPLSCKPGRAAIYVYVNGTGATWQIVGFTPESVLFQDKYLKTLRTPCRLLPRQDLYNPHQLRQAVTQLSRRVIPQVKTIQPGVHV
jgi:hypothetical protein